MEKIFIKNRHDKRIAVVIEKPEKPIGLAFVMHGLGGIKSAPHIATFAKVFYDNGYTTIRFDATHTYGESEGNYEDATITNYYEDLEDVIAWAKSQPWYQEPFVLCGHSLGGICSGLYAEKYPERIKALAPLSTVISGRWLLEDYYKDDLVNWEKTGWLMAESGSRPSLIKRLKWSYTEDAVKHDLLDKFKKITMPTLLLVGEEDIPCPLFRQQILFDKLNCRKELHIIKNAPHSFRDDKHLKEIYQIMDKWLKSLN